MKRVIKYNFEFFRLNLFEKTVVYLDKGIYGILRNR